MSAQFYVNPHIRDTERIFPMQERYEYLRYDMNENPEGLPAEFVSSVLKEVTPEFLSIYPEPDRFLKKYADFIGVGFENVMATNGSDMAIRYLLETFGEPGKEVVTVSPSFEMYWVNCSLLGLKHVPVPYLEDLTISIDEIVSAISGDTRIVVLLNPNNPVGNVYTEDELQKVIRRTREVGAVLIIDEAYHYFYEKTFLRYAMENDNVIILRTFSKLMSLAALRIGVIISSPLIIKYAQKARLTFDVNALALLFAERLLERPDLIQLLIDTENEGKAFILSALREHGYWVRDCRGNFIFVKPVHDAKTVADRLQTEKKVLVHAYGNPLLKDYLRVSVGSVEAMKRFLDTFLSVDASTPPT